LSMRPRPVLSGPGYTFSKWRSRFIPGPGNGRV
jgi:hypothetical protein